PHGPRNPRSTPLTPLVVARRVEAPRGEGAQLGDPDLVGAGERQLVLGEEQDAPRDLVRRDPTAEELAHTALVDRVALVRDRAHDDELAEALVGNADRERGLQVRVPEQRELDLDG